MQAWDAKITIQFYVTQNKMSQLYTADVRLTWYGSRETKQDDRSGAETLAVTQAKQYRLAKVPVHA